MKLKICLLAMLCLFFKLNGQSINKSKGLNVGDIVPDITLSKILNYPGNSAKISDFKNKLLILDFWATWCGNCIEHFPENYAIQQQFPDQVQVLLVSSKIARDTEDGLKKFFERRKSVYQFPCVILDTALTGMFPHITIPHCVIIKNTKVLAITDGDNINMANIRRMIDVNSTTLYVKRDARFKTDKPLFFEGNGGDLPENYYRSVLTGYLPFADCPNGFQTDKDGLINRIYAVNQNLIVLYMFAYPEFSGFEDSRIIYDIPHPGKFVKNSNDNPDVFNRFYSYESSFPPVSKSEAVKYLKTDLYRYFGLKVDSQYRDTLCYILHIDPKNPPKKVAAGSKRESNLLEKINIPKYFHNSSIEDLRNDLQIYFLIPFFDETGYTDNISLELPVNSLNEKELTASLAKQGIILSKEKRRVNFMIIRQNSQPVQ